MNEITVLNENNCSRDLRDDDDDYDCFFNHFLCTVCKQRFHSNWDPLCDEHNFCSSFIFFSILKVKIEKENTIFIYLSYDQIVV